MTTATRNTPDQARETAQNVMERGKQVASNVASNVAEKADSITSKVGDTMGTAADKIREYAPKEGMLATAANKAADTIASSGKYLSEEGFRGISSDLAEMIKKNPVPALLVGLGIGYLFARATSSRS